MTFDWGIRKIFIKIVVFEMDLEILLEFYKGEIIEERKIETNVGGRKFYSTFGGEQVVYFKWSMGYLY